MLWCKVLLEAIGNLREVLDLIEEDYPDVHGSSSVSCRMLANVGSSRGEEKRKNSSQKEEQEEGQPEEETQKERSQS